MNNNTRGMIVGALVLLFVIVAFFIYSGGRPSPSPPTDTTTPTDTNRPANTNNTPSQ